MALYFEMQKIYWLKLLTKVRPLGLKHLIQRPWPHYFFAEIDILPCKQDKTFVKKHLLCLSVNSFLQFFLPSPCGIYDLRTGVRLFDPSFEQELSEK